MPENIDIELLETLIEEHRCCDGSVFLYESNEYVVVNGKVQLDPTDSQRIVIATCGECDKILFTEEM